MMIKFFAHKLINQAKFFNKLKLLEYLHTFFVHFKTIEAFFC